MNEQTCISTWQASEGSSEKTLGSGEAKKTPSTRRISPATVAAKIRRESYIFPPPVKDACWIPLSNEKFALVDAGDFERTNEKIWTAAKGNTTHYALFRDYTTKRTVFLHRWLFDLQDETILIDHINFDGLDCRRGNLRMCSKTENNRHSRKWRSETTSRFKGVSFAPRHLLKWNAQISINRKTIRLGRFATEAEAAAAYNTFASQQFGEFAILNVIPE